MANESTGAAQLHIPVLLPEVLSFLRPAPGLRILDGTLGLGGHSESILQTLEASGFSDAELLGLDKDVNALALAQKRLSSFGKRVHTRHSPFSEAAEALDSLGWDSVDFALIDIGVSSMQIDMAERGFSFHADGPLDMRMDDSSGTTAAALVNKAPVATLRKIIAEFGEEPMAGRIARAIDDARSRQEIRTTLELAGIVEQAYPAKWRATSRNHPATRTFQALRMEVNNELGELRSFLESVTPRLAPQGRIVVISFHSLEDRLVKHFFRDQATGCRCPRHVPVCICHNTPTLQILTRKPLMASPEECSKNSRAGSAKLRAAEKL